MKKIMAILLAGSLLIIAAGFEQTPNETRFRPTEFGNLFLKGEYEKIYNQTSDEFKAQVPLNDFMHVSGEFNKGVSKYRLESTILLSGNKQYIWTDQSKTKGISVIVQADRTIAGLNLLPLEPHSQTDKYYTKNKYTMPVKNRWLVYWGGTNVLLNYHYAYESQRYAYDLLQMKKGQTYKGNPLKNENYYAFGQQVAAPLEGTVIKTVDGLKDNVPGELNPDHPEGNYVVIKHKNGEYSILAHFMKNSIKVREGEKVKTGQILGKCGNSGNSTEAHIHFQVSSSPDIMTGKSIRIQFENGKEPVRGEYTRK